MPPYLMGGPFYPRRRSGGCPAGPDRPDLDTDCILHLRADLGVTTEDGTNWNVLGGTPCQVVTGWADQSGAGDPGRDFTVGGVTPPPLNACHLEENYNNKPTIGDFVQYYSGAPDVRLTSGTWDTTYNHFTLFVIGHSINSNNRCFTWESDTDILSVRNTFGVDGVSDGLLIVFSGPFFTNISSFYATPIYNLDNSNPNLLGCEFNGSSSKGYANDLSATNCTGTLAASSLGDAPFSIGNGNDFNGLNYGVDRIAEVIAYDGAPDSGEMIELTNYFNERYGMSLP